MTSVLKEEEIRTQTHAEGTSCEAQKEGDHAQTRKENMKKPTLPTP